MQNIGGYIIMAGIFVCLLCSVWIGIVEYREEKSAESFEKSNRCLSARKRMQLTREAQIEAWKMLEIENDPRKEWRRSNER